MHSPDVEFSQSLHRAGPCKLDMVLYTEEVATVARSSFYPVNSMRNLALKLARTEVHSPPAVVPLRARSTSLSPSSSVRNCFQKV